MVGLEDIKSSMNLMNPCMHVQEEKGVAYSPAYDSLEEYAPVPGYDTKEYEETVFGEVHASILTLLEGTHRDHLQQSESGQRLQGTKEGLELIKTSSPVFTETMSQLLYSLRLFSFG